MLAPHNHCGVWLTSSNDLYGGPATAWYPKRLVCANSAKARTAAGRCYQHRPTTSIPSCTTRRRTLTHLTNSGPCPPWCRVLAPHPDLAHGKDLGVISANGLSVSAALVGDLDGAHLRIHVHASDVRDTFDLHPAVAELLGEVIRTWPPRKIKQLGEALETGAAILGGAA